MTERTFGDESAPRASSERHANIRSDLPRNGKELLARRERVHGDEQQEIDYPDLEPTDWYSHDEVTSLDELVEWLWLSIH